MYCDNGTGVDALPSIAVLASVEYGLYIIAPLRYLLMFVFTALVMHLYVNLCTLILFIVFWLHRCMTAQTAHNVGTCHWTYHAIFTVLQC